METRSAQPASGIHRYSEQRGGLARTMLLAFLPLIAFLMVLTGIIGAVFAVRIAEQRAREQLELVASLKQDEIVRWVRERERDLATLATEESIQADSARLLDPAAPDAERLAAYSALGVRLNSFLEKKVPFAELFVLDAARGKTIVSTDMLQEGFLHPTDGYFVQGLAGPYRSEPVFDSQLNVPTILVSRPLLGQDGQPFAVLVGRVNLSDLGELMQQRLSMGQTGETYLVDDRLQAVTRLRFGEAGQAVNTEGARLALERQDSGSAEYDNYRASRVFGIYRWIPELQVALLSEMSVDEALSSRATVLLGVSGVAILGCILGAVVVVYVSRRITRPLVRLTDVAVQMAAGDLSQRSNIDQRNEIGALSRAYDDMAGQLQDLIGTLEQRVADRTRALEQRAVQLATAADVGRAAASILELDSLYRQVVSLVQERFDLYYVGLFVLDETRLYAILQAGTGEAGQAMKDRGHSLKVGGLSMVGSACASRRSRIALDVGTEAVRFDNPLLPLTRSEMAVPLMVGDRVLGALDVQSVQPSAFDDEDVAILQLLADQVAVAVDNAQRLSDEAAQLEATSPLYRASHRLAAAATVDEIVQAVLASVADTEADACAVGRLIPRPDGQPAAVAVLGAWDRKGSSGLTLPAGQQPALVDLVAGFWTAEDILQEDGPAAGHGQFLSSLGGRAFVNLPLRSGAQVIGFVLVSRAAPGPFSPVSLRLYETLVDHAGLSLERDRLYQESQGRAAREQLLREATASIRSAPTLDDAIRRAAREMSRALGAAETMVRIGTEEELIAALRGPAPAVTEGDGHG